MSRIVTQWPHFIMTRHSHIVYEEARRHEKSNLSNCHAHSILVQTLKSYPSPSLTSNTNVFLYHLASKSAREAVGNGLGKSESQISYPLKKINSIKNQIFHSSKTSLVNH